MSFFKKKLTEQEAASFFITHIIKEAESAWPIIYKQLKETFKEKFVIENEKKASFDLTLAAIAQDLQALKNLFPKDQAERIEKLVLKKFGSDIWGEYAVDEVKKYGEEFQKGIQNINAGGDPLGAIPTRLIQRWLGKNIQNFDVKINGKKTGIIDPFLSDIIVGVLTAFIGTWKRIKDNFNLIKEDMPSNKSNSSNIISIILYLTLLAEFFLFSYENLTFAESLAFNMGSMLGGLALSIIVLTVANKLLDVKMKEVALLGSTIIFNFSNFQGLWRSWESWFIFFPLVIGIIVTLNYYLHKKHWRFLYLGGIYLTIILTIIFGG